MEGAVLRNVMAEVELTNLSFRGIALTTASYRLEMAVQPSFSMKWSTSDLKQLEISASRLSGFDDK